jgi:hypothetical protein
MQHFLANMNQQSDKKHSQYRHGHAGKGSSTPEYNVWCGIKQRCLDEKSEVYPKYGRRGITICERWNDDFKNFLEDMGPRPPNTSLDRIDNDKGYDKENCRWATKTQQAQNRRYVNSFTYKGETKCLTQWGREYNIPYSTLRNRLIEFKWTIEDALETPVSFSSLKRIK